MSKINEKEIQVNGLAFYVAGIQFRLDAFASVANEARIGNVVTLEPEPDNKYDPFAVKVILHDEHVGYVPRSFSEWVTKNLHNCNASYIIRINLDSEPWTALKIKLEFNHDEEE